MNGLTIEEKKMLKVCDLIEELDVEVNAEFIKNLLIQCNRNALHLKYENVDKFSDEGWMVDVYQSNN